MEMGTLLLFTSKTITESAMITNQRERRLFFSGVKFIQN
jgi:hypothetical protein